jgi:hypothetical protein
MSFIRRIWKGETALWKAFWLLGFWAIGFFSLLIDYSWSCWPHPLIPHFDTIPLIHPLDMSGTVPPSSFDPYPFYVLLRFLLFLYSLIVSVVIWRSSQNFSGSKFLKYVSRIALIFLILFALMPIHFFGFNGFLLIYLALRFLLFLYSLIVSVIVWRSSQNFSGSKFWKYVFRIALIFLILCALMPINLLLVNLFEPSEQLIDINDGRLDQEGQFQPFRPVETPFF